MDWGSAGLADLAADSAVDLLLNAVVGIAGLPPLLAALRQGTTVALANKEPLVSAGELVMATSTLHGAQIIPVDSEHSAIFQCLQGVDPETVQEIVLTASGGPFLGRTPAELQGITPEEASRHPRWQMGVKISIDSATMVNKALEMIEARWLFSLRPEQIRVVIHPQSIVHSLITLQDGATLAQLSPPDMRLPIAYALSWPDRWSSSLPTLDWSQIIDLHFEPPDERLFPALSLVRQVMAEGGDLPVVFNAANEEAVSLFRQELIPFTAIVPLVTAVTHAHAPLPLGDLESIMQLHEATLAKTRAIARRFHRS